MSGNSADACLVSWEGLAEIMPVYLRLATSDMLENCKGDTQNANESLHNVIWGELPKTKFFSLRRMMYGIYRAVARFNHGTELLEAAEHEVGEEGTLIRKRLDKKRLLDAKRKASKKEEQKANMIRRVQQEEDLLAEEGQTYGPGIGPLPWWHRVW